MSTSPIIETVDLTKVYSHTTVVNKLNLRINAGEIFGFLGPNGAGKTTTILMLLGLTEPTSGTVRVCGFNSTREPLKVKRQVGYVPERIGFYEDMTASQNLAYTVRLNGVPERLVAERVAEALDTVRLADRADHNVGTFSHGMKQRLAIADVLVKMPEVAILDEPTLGIDPEAAKGILDLIGRIARERQMTIIMSSHQLNHIQQICTRVGIMAGGQLKAEGPVDQLGREALGSGKYQIEVQLEEISEPIVAAIRGLDGVTEIVQSESLLLISCEKDLRPQMAKVIVDNGGLLVQMRVRSYTLEDIYLKYFAEG